MFCCETGIVSKFFDEKIESIPTAINANIKRKKVENHIGKPSFFIIAFSIGKAWTIPRNNPSFVHSYGVKFKGAANAIAGYSSNKIPAVIANIVSSGSPIIPVTGLKINDTLCSTPRYIRALDRI